MRPSWSVAETARRFDPASATIAGWMKRLDEAGAEALVQTRTPVNRFPDAVPPTKTPPSKGSPPRRHAR